MVRSWFVSTTCRTAGSPRLPPTITWPRQPDHAGVRRTTPRPRVCAASRCPLCCPTRAHAQHYPLGPLSELSARNDSVHSTGDTPRRTLPMIGVRAPCFTADELPPAFQRPPTTSAASTAGNQPRRRPVAVIQARHVHQPIARLHFPTRRTGLPWNYGGPPPTRSAEKSSATRTLVRLPTYTLACPAANTIGVPIIRAVVCERPRTQSAAYRTPGIPPLRLSCDNCWSRRSHGHRRLTSRRQQPC